MKGQNFMVHLPVAVGGKDGSGTMPAFQED